MEHTLILHGLDASLRSVATELGRLWREAGPGDDTNFAARLSEASHCVHRALIALGDEDEPPS